jgi:hypothetical protein
MAPRYKICSAFVRDLKDELILACAYIVYENEIEKRPTSVGGLPVAQHSMSNWIEPSEVVWKTLEKETRGK